MALTLQSPAADLTVDSRSPHWLQQALDLLARTGIVIVLDIVSEDARQRAREGFRRVQDGQRDALPAAAVRDAEARGEYELRLLPAYDPFFFSFLQYPQQLALLDAFLAPSAVLRFQIGSILKAGNDTGRRGPWHMNFRRVLNGYRAALEIGFSIDGMEPGHYQFALGSHQRGNALDPTELEAISCTFAIPPGAMFAFDGTLWHREGSAATIGDRRLVLHQFVHHFFKQHMDYVRALGADVVRTLPARTQTLLGWDSRLPASLAEFYVEPAERLYKPGQG